MLVSACGAVLAGWLGWMLAGARVVYLVEPMASRVPTGKHVAFLIDGFAHTASYAFGFLGGLVVLAMVWRSRLVGQSSRRAAE